MCSLLSRVQLFETPWTVTCQVPLSMGFSWQGYWRGLPFLPPGDLPDSGIKPTSPVSPAIQADSFTAELSGIYLRVAGKIPWSEEPGGLQSMGPQRLRHDWVTNSFYTHLQVCVRVYYYHQFFSNLQNTSVFFVFLFFLLFHNKCLQTLHSKRNHNLNQKLISRDQKLILEREWVCVCAHSCTVLEVSKTAESKK